MTTITATPKSRAHVECNKVLISALAAVKHASTDEPKDTRRYLDETEHAAWYSAIAPNYVNDHQFWIAQAAGFLTEVGRTQHRETMKTPAIKAVWEIARAQEFKYMTSLHEDSLSTDTPVPQGAFGDGWPVYHKRFLGLEFQLWHIAHAEHFSNAKWAQKDRTVQEYFVQVFAPLANIRDQSDGWDTTAGWAKVQQLNTTAHAFFANLNRHIKDVMLNDDTFDAKSFEQWVIHNLYTKAIEVETSALYVSQQAARKATQGRCGCRQGSSG